MGCKRCEDFQVLRDAGGELPSYYVRVGAGNVELVGCPEHVGELIEQLRQLHRGGVAYEATYPPSPGPGAGAQ
jgi:hypothetical protein